MGELQKLLPVESVQDLFLCRPPHPPCGRIFRARPYCALTDRDEVYALCKASIMDENNLDVCGIDQFTEYPELVGDWIAGPFLQSCQEYCFVVEDEYRNIVGFAFAAKDSSDFYDSIHNSYLQSMKSKYPMPSQNAEGADIDAALDGQDDKIMDAQKSIGPCVWGDGILSPKEMITYLHQASTTTTHFTTPHSVCSRYPSILVIRIQASVLDTAAPKRLLASLLSALKTSGSTGVHGQVRRSERNLRDLYCRLGFFEISMLGEEQTEIEFLGRLL